MCGAGPGDLGGVPGVGFGRKSLENLAQTNSKAMSRHRQEPARCGFLWVREVALEVVCRAEHRWTWSGARAGGSSRAFPGAEFGPEKQQRLRLSGLRLGFNRSVKVHKILNCTDKNGFINMFNCKDT